MKKDLSVSELNDLYGGLLTPHQREMVASYYDFDLSLAEIAENANVSRQAVRDVIVKAVEQLNGYESVLGMREGAHRLRKRIGEAIRLIDDNETNRAREVLNEIEEQL